MNLEYMEDLPNAFSRNKKSFNNSLRALIFDFYDSGAPCARVNYTSDEYSSGASVYSGMSYIAKKLELPISVRIIQGDVYLKREED